MWWMMVMSCVVPSVALMSGQGMRKSQLDADLKNGPHTTGLSSCGVAMNLQHDGMNGLCSHPSLCRVSRGWHEDEGVSDREGPSPICRQKCEVDRLVSTEFDHGWDLEAGMKGPRSHASQCLTCLSPAYNRFGEFVCCTKRSKKSSIWRCIKKNSILHEGHLSPVQG